MYVTEAHFPIPPDVVNTSGVKEPCMFYLPAVHIGYKTSAFGIHEGGMLMVTACFDRREHLGGKHVHQKNAHW